MKKNRYTFGIIVGVFLLVLLLIFKADNCIMREQPDAVIEDYQIIVENNVYSQGTQTGVINLKIRSKGSSFSKLFYTSEDVLHNGFDFIVDDEYMLQVSQGKEIFKCRVYETEYNKGVQQLKLYYINTAERLKETSVNVQIVRSKTKKTEGEITVELHIEKEYITTDHIPANHNFIISSTGIKYPNLPAYNQPFFSSSTLFIKSKKDEYLMAIGNDISDKKVNEKEIVKPKLKYFADDYEGYKIFVVELEDWKEVEKVKMGNYEYYFTREVNIE